MNIFKWFRLKTSPRGKALRLYERGMAKARKHDQEGAIADYCSAIDLPNAPEDIVAMALLNRALAEIAVGELDQGFDDLMAVLEMDGAPARVKKTAKQKIAKRNSRTGGRNVEPNTS